MPDQARILVVDDEPSITDLVSLALKYEGFEVRSAATARQARHDVMDFRPALMILDVGLPDEKRVRKACGRANEVLVYSYGGHAAQLWWQQVGDKVSRSHKLTVIDLPQAGTRALAGLAARNMQLQFTIQDGQVWVADERESVQLDPKTILAAKPEWS